MTKQVVKQNPAKAQKVARDNSLMGRFKRLSFSEKVMYVLSILIVLAMVLGMFVSFAPIQ